MNIFDDVKFPDTFTKDVFKKYYTRELFINSILWQCAELELLFNTPTALNYMMIQWSNQQYPIWCQLVETMEYEYNPIENYNRKETWDQLGKHVTNNNDTYTGNSTVTTHTDQNSETHATGNLTTQATGVDSVNAFNIRYQQEPEQNPPDGNPQLWPSAGSRRNGKDDTKDDNNGEFHEDGTQNSNYMSTDTKKEDHGYGDHYEGHMLGNIGVTTTQQLIEAQREVVKFDIVKFVVDSFIQNLCLGVW